MTFYVYVVQSLGFAKVGISAKPDKRALALADSTPHDLTLMCVYRYPDREVARLFEKMSHNVLKARGLHHKGEWFVFSECLLPSLDFLHASYSPCYIEKKAAEFKSLMLAKQMMTGFPSARKYNEPKHIKIPVNRCCDFLSEKNMQVAAKSLHSENFDFIEDGAIDAVLDYMSSFEIQKIKTDLQRHEAKINKVRGYEL